MGGPGEVCAGMNGKRAVVGICGPTVEKLADDMKADAAAAVVVFYDNEGRIKTGWTPMKTAELCQLLLALDADIRADLAGGSE